MVNVNCPRVSVLRDDARHHLVERVPPLVTSRLKVCAMTRNHGSGLTDVNDEMRKLNGNALWLFMHGSVFAVFPDPHRPGIGHGLSVLSNHDSPVMPGAINVGVIVSGDAKYGTGRALPLPHSAFGKMAQLPAGIQYRPYLSATRLEKK